MEDFTSELKARLGEKILGVYLFGSAAKGTATEVTPPVKNGPITSV